MTGRRTKRPTLRDLALEVQRLTARVAELQRKELEDRNLIETTRLAIAPKSARRRSETQPATPPAMAKGSARIPLVTDSTVGPAFSVREEAPLAARIEALLRRRVMDYAAIADEVGESDARVGTAFAAMRRKGLVFQVGTDERPRWVWVIDDSIDTQDLHAHVERLIKERPLSFAELSEACPVNPNRLKHALTTLQKRGAINLGSRGRAVWYLPPGR